MKTKTAVSPSRAMAAGLVMMLALVLSATANAQATRDSVADEAVISTRDDGPSDAAIHGRISGILKEIDALAAVSTEVSQGVVTLTGQVANEAQAERAVRLAGRLEGVVSVEDKIERTLDVRGNVAPILQDLQAKWRQWVRGLPLYGVALAMFLAIALAGHWIAKWNGLWRRVAPNPFLADLLSQTLRVAVLLLAMVVALNILGATALLGTILGGAGVVGLAIGFAVKDTIENYIASVMLSLRQPFRARDHVVINQHEGIVIRLNSRATILMTLDGNHLRIPNAEVFKGVILNYTRNPERRFQFTLGVDAEDDPVAAMQAGLDAIKALDFILDEPRPVAVIKTVGDSNILLQFLAWVDQTHTDFGKARSLAIRAAMQAIAEGGFTMPEPIVRLRFDGAAPDAVSPPKPSEWSPAKDERAGPSPRPLQDAEAMDVRPDKHIEEKVSEERAAEGGEDLLDSSQPVE